MGQLKIRFSEQIDTPVANKGEKGGIALALEQVEQIVFLTPCFPLARCKLAPQRALGSLQTSHLDSKS